VHYYCKSYVNHASFIKSEVENQIALYVDGSRAIITWDITNVILFELHGLPIFKTNIVMTNSYLYSFLVQILYCNLKSSQALSFL